MNLTCEVQSFTTPNVTWTSNTDVILPSASVVSDDDIHTSVLTLVQITLEYIGEYTCTAENEGGEISDMIRVDVYGKYMSVSIHLSVYLSVSLSVYLCLSLSLSLSLSLCLCPYVSLSSSSSSGNHFSWIC